MRREDKVRAAIEAACCDGFRTALHRGTDNEGYGPLIYDISRPDDPVKWMIGSGPVARPAFCPWCGSGLSAKKELSDEQ